MALFTKYSDTYIQGLLAKHGWKLSDCDRYRGMRLNHIVNCTRCGHRHVKRLDNLIYRAEPCPACGFTGLPNKAEHIPLVSPDELEKVLKRLDAIEKELQELRQARQSETVPTHVTRECERLFRKLVSKRGFRKFHRNMNRDEWMTTELAVAASLIGELADDARTVSEWAEQFGRVRNTDKSRRSESILFTVIPAQYHQKALDILRIKVVKA